MVAINKKLFLIFSRALFVLTIVLITLFIFYFVSSVAYPFLFGLALAFLINPIVNFFELRIGINRTISVILTLVLAFCFLAALITFLIAEMISGSAYLSTSVPLHLKTLMKYLENFFITTLMPIYDQFIRIFNTLDAKQQSTIMNYVQAFTSQFASNVGTSIQKLFNGLSEILISLPNLATVILFSFLATFFISKDWYRLRKYFTTLVPSKVSISISRVMHDLKHALFGYLMAQFTLISITCLIVLVGLLILQVDYPITIAITIAVIDLIPYVGTGLIFIPWIIYSFFSEQHALTIGLSVLYGVVVIQRQIMEPKVLSQSIGIDPLATLFSLFVGFQLFGFLGLIIGPAVLVLIRTLHRANVFSDVRDYIMKKTE